MSLYCNSLIHIQIVKRIAGAVQRPMILDETTILALIEYDTAFPWYMAFKTRIGLCNLVSGQVILLIDQGRLQDGDDQVSATTAPHGDAVAYWVCPANASPRLTIQRLHASVLRTEQDSLSSELEKSRERFRMQMAGE